MYVAPAYVDLAAPRRPTGAPTLSRLFAEEFAQTLPPRDVARFDRSLQNIEIGTDQFVRGRINASHPCCSPGVAVMDTVGPGDTLIVYADGRRLGGVGVAHPPLVALRESVAIAKRQNDGQRRRTLIETAVALRPKTRPADRWGDGVDELRAVALDLVVIAGLLLNERDLERLGSIQGSIPALAIIALTDTRGRPSVETRHLVTRFPGRWLGTRSPAGSA